MTTGDVEAGATFTIDQVVGTLVFTEQSTNHGGTYATPTQFVFNGTDPNDPPVVTSGSESRTYVEDNPPLVVNPTMTVSDADDTNLTGATITITSNYNAAQDVLAFTSQSGITGVWDAGTGTLTLSGTATVAQYQAALRTVTYQNTSQQPTTARTNPRSWSA